MKLKLDESLTHRLQAPLRELGHDVSTAADEGLLGKSDAEVAATAAVSTGYCSVLISDSRIFAIIRLGRIRESLCFVQ